MIKIDQNFIKAAKSNNIEEVIKLLTGDITTDTKNEALVEAAYKDNIEIVKILLDAGANANAKDTDYITALHYAAGNNNHDMIELLLKHGANINVIDNYYKGTPLIWLMSNLQGNVHKAARAKNIQLGSDYSAVLEPELIKCNKAVDLLLEGTDLSIIDMYKKTVLHWTAEKCNVKIRKENKSEALESASSIHTSIANNSLEIQRKILDALKKNYENYSSLINLPTKGGYTPVSLALSNNTNQLETIKMYFEYGAKDSINTKSDYNNTLLSRALLARNNLEVIKFLIEQGANINDVCREGTVLKIAMQCYGKDLSCARLLIESNVHINYATDISLYREIIDLREEKKQHNIEEYTKKIRDIELFLKTLYEFKVRNQNNDEYKDDIRNINEAIEEALNTALNFNIEEVVKEVVKFNDNYCSTDNSEFVDMVSTSTIGPEEVVPQEETIIGDVKEEASFIE